MSPFRPGTKSERIWTLLRAGVSPADVALTTKAHPKFVAQVAARLKEVEAHPPQRVDARVRGWTEERIERLKALYAAGVSCSEIAARLGGGITRNAVLGKVHRLGLPLRGGDWGRQRKPLPGRRREGRIRARPKSLSERLLMAPLPPDEPPSHTNVHLLERRDDQCCWIIGEAADQMMCGAPAIPGLRPAWCAFHAAKGFGNPIPQRTAPAEQTAPVEAA